MYSVADVKGNWLLLTNLTDRRLKEAQEAFDASIDNGMTFFDTAEVYGTAVRNRNLVHSFFPDSVLMAHLFN